MPGAVSPGVKRPGIEADHSPISSVEVKIEWSHAFHYLECLHRVTVTTSPIIIIIGFYNNVFVNFADD
jgi:hypothetical protein